MGAELTHNYYIGKCVSSPPSPIVPRHYLPPFFVPRYCLPRFLRQKRRMGAEQTHNAFFNSAPIFYTIILNSSRGVVKYCGHSDKSSFVAFFVFN